MAVVVSFVSEKGGVGKTTACYHVAVALNRMHEKRVLVLDADYRRGGISGRFFPDLIEEFAEGAAPGTTLYHKYQQLYSASDRTRTVDIRSWAGWGAKIDVMPADPRLSTIASDKLPSAYRIRVKTTRLYENMQIMK